MPPSFALYRTLLPILGDILWGRSQRSLRADAQALTAARLDVQVLGGDCLPERGPFLLVFNHYTRPGFGVWWTALALAAALPVEAHWIMTSAWTGSHLTPISRVLLRRVADRYRFTAMPPMPPAPGDAADRAAAVRQVIGYARATPEAVIALAPEGRDFPGSRLGMPPPGAGRFMLHLGQISGTIIPAGVYEENDKLVVNFGPPFALDIPAGLAPAEQDLVASRAVMDRIAALMPVHLRGEFMSDAG